MRSPFAAAALTVLVPFACVKEISSEERLEREISPGPAGDRLSAEELAKISCGDVPEQLARARAERDETARLIAYMDLHGALKKKVGTLEEAMARDPDIRYQEATKGVVDSHGACVQQQADVRFELETFVRELVQVPIVEEIKGGNTVSVARLDFNTLRMAVEALGPDDKEALLVKIASAEKKIEAEPAATGQPARRKRGR